MKMKHYFKVKQVGWAKGRYLSRQNSRYEGSEMRDVAKWRS